MRRRCQPLLRTWSLAAALGVRLPVALEARPRRNSAWCPRARPPRRAFAPGGEARGVAWSTSTRGTAEQCVLPTFDDRSRRLSASARHSGRAHRDPLGSARRSTVVAWHRDHVIEGGDAGRSRSCSPTAASACRARPQGRADRLAVVRPDAKGVEFVDRLRRSRRAEVGDLVLAIGDPFGVGERDQRHRVAPRAPRSTSSTTKTSSRPNAAINPGWGAARWSTWTGSWSASRSPSSRRAVGLHGLGFRDFLPTWAPRRSISSRPRPARRTGRGRALRSSRSRWISPIPWAACASWCPRHQPARQGALPRAQGFSP